MNTLLGVDVYRTSPYLETYSSLKTESVAKWMNQLTLLNLTDPFEVSFEEYLQLPLEKVEELQIKTLEEKREWIEERCKEKNVDWIVVCEGKVVLWGKASETRPAKEELKQVGQKHNKIPFLFFSVHFGPEIEEGIGWYKTEINKNDYYPTLKIAVLSESESRREIVSTFDTGAHTTHLDRDELISNGILSRDYLYFPQRSNFAGKPYFYDERKVKVLIVDENGRAMSASISCWCVLDWQNSPYWKNYPNRHALLGRDILLNFPIKVELNGIEKKSCIYLIEEVKT